MAISKCFKKEFVGDNRVGFLKFYFDEGRTFVFKTDFQVGEVGFFWKIQCVYMFDDTVI